METQTEENREAGTYAVATVYLLQVVQVSLLPEEPKVERSDRKFCQEDYQEVTEFKVVMFDVIGRCYS